MQDSMKLRGTRVVTPGVPQEYPGGTPRDLQGVPGEAYRVGTPGVSLGTSGVTLGYPLGGPLLPPVLPFSDNEQPDLCIS